jgi:hypothetical protein
VVVALALVLVVPAAAAVNTEEKPSGVTVINDTVLAAPGTTQATIDFVAAQYGPPPPTHTRVGKGIGPIAD